MSEKVIVLFEGKKTEAQAGSVISEIISGETPCGGHGKCGKCKVTIKGQASEVTDAEREHLTPKEISDGVRLACVARALGDCEIRRYREGGAVRVLTDSEVTDSELSPAFCGYGVAIDLGTTTVVGKCYGTDGVMRSVATCLNSQTRFGADVISRIEASLEGERTALALAVREDISRIVCRLTEEAQIDSREIDYVVITGNTVMLSLLVGESAEPFSHAPFVAERLFGEELDAETVGLVGLAPCARVYLPPCISAFVGADTVCAIMATKMTESREGLLVDVGTNGEMALWRDGKLTVCSTAAGPAFEGVGISRGMRGEVGAIDKVTLSGDKLVAHVIGEGEPRGICGSGLVDGVACMLRGGFLDEDGYLDDNFEIASGVCLTKKDIRMLQLAKSAVSAGLITLLKTEDRAFSGEFFIAGGFGSYLDLDNAINIGLIPRCLKNAARVVGNASLAGATTLLLNKDAKKTACGIRSLATTLDLSKSAVFSDQYLMGMTLCEVE